MAQENFATPMCETKVRDILVNATLPDVGKRRGYYRRRQVTPGCA